MKRSLLQKLFTTYDYLAGRYSAEIVTKSGDIEQCIEIRKKVFLDELKRKDTKSNKNIGEKDQWDHSAIHVACRDTKSGQFIGTMRIVRASEMKADRASVNEYRLDKFATEHYPQIFVINRLAVLRSHRAGPAAVLMAQKCYQTGLKNDVIASVCICEPNLYPLYRRLGYLPLASIDTSPLGGYRLPLFLIPHDYQHLRNVRSPFLSVARSLDFPKNDEGIKWLTDNNTLHKNLPIGFAPFNGEGSDFTFIITNGISESGKKALFSNAINIKCRHGDVVVKEGAGDNGFGFVKAGALQVVKNKKIISVLGSGDVFGEIAFLLNQPRSASLVVATDDTEIVLLSRSCINKLTRKEDQVSFWKNLATIMASRLRDS